MKTRKELTIEELRKNLPDWKPTSPEQEQTLLEITNAARSCKMYRPRRQSTET